LQYQELKIAYMLSYSAKIQMNSILEAVHTCMCMHVYEHTRTLHHRLVSAAMSPLCNAIATTYSCPSCIARCAWPWMGQGRKCSIGAHNGVGSETADLEDQMLQHCSMGSFPPFNSDGVSAAALRLLHLSSTGPQAVGESTWRVDEMSLARDPCNH
jgi:hypothetical protein